ncbi:MAG: SGNH/GDSL hydrolase family protein [Candidatus Omnitrophica bacterium]|nr:SGNH/GDSL hydrolase family protein [Candidatus Omnitrophota bacterium]
MAQTLMKRLPNFLKVFLLYLFVFFLTLACAEKILERYFSIDVFRGESKNELAQITGWSPTTREDGAFLCDTPHAFEKPPGKVRVLLLGDSILDCNESGQPYSESLAAMLAGELGSGYEVINISAGGWGNDQEYLAYRHLGRKYSPDIVLLFFTPANDIFNNVSRKAIFQDRGKPYFELEHGKLVLNDRAFQKKTGFLLQWLNKTQLGTRVNLLFQKFKKRVEANVLESEPNSHLLTFLDPWPKKIEQGWEITRAILLEMRKDAESDSAKFAVVYVPNGAVMTAGWQGDLSRFNRNCVGYLKEAVPVQFAGTSYHVDMFKPYREIKQFCGSSGIPLIDTLEQVAPFGLEHTAICYDGLHLSRKGKELLSGVVLEFIKNLKASSP